MFKPFFFYLSLTFTLLGYNPLDDSYYKYDGNGRIVIPQNDIIQKLPSDGGKYWNRLIFESSPYLLQHAANPVNWYPWSEEAFDLAKKLDKPIFLSIGYTTCHWCHVMEHESFEDDDVAKLMNETFINIKVDREERPDIDQVYMEITQILNNRGGWPMTVILTPEKEAFFAGTYFPKNTRGNRVGMLELIPSVNKMWSEKRDSLLTDAKNITNRLQKRQSNINVSQRLRDDLLERAFKQYTNQFDKKYGGFGDAPKFPKPHDYMFLSRYYMKTGDKEAIKMVEKSLISMRKGGIFDQIGMGFHRYSTDTRWLVPHFEKMLYDQAMLIHAYLDAYLATKDEFYKKVVGEIITYIFRDMTSNEGGFYSAEDADSEGEEGVFYVWSIKDLQEIFDDKEVEIVTDFYNCQAKGNWREGRRHGQTNIFHVKQDTSIIAKKHEISIIELKEKLHTINERLFSIREERVHPQKDDKILTDWNGLMISALARSARILNNEKYGQKTIKAMDFIIETMVEDDGKLKKRYRNGKAGLDGVLDDYAFIIWGLIELYQYNFDPVYLELAIKLSDYQYSHFWDKNDGGFFFNSDISEELLIRSKEIYDGAIPSGNSVSANNYIRLARILSKPDYEDIANNLLKSFGGKINRYGPAYSHMLTAVDFIEGPSYEIVIIDRDGNTNNSTKVSNILNELNLYEHDRKVIIYINDNNRSATEKLIPFSTNFPHHNDIDPWIYVCKNFSCDLPTQSIKKVKELLSK